MPRACQDDGIFDLAQDARRRQELLRQARDALGPARTRAAEQRGAVMSLETAAAFAIIQTEAGTTGTPEAAQLSARERELVTLVAQGRTDTQIAGQLYISVNTVRSHLDRIRDKSGYRRRAALTRLALQAGLI
jgi:DNA-binding NarL/FixJ family response regulator